eukprot:gene5653-1010_t
MAAFSVGVRSSAVDHPGGETTVPEACFSVEFMFTSSRVDAPDLSAAGIQEDVVLGDELCQRLVPCQFGAGVALIDPETETVLALTPSPWRSPGPAASSGRLPRRWPRMNHVPPLNHGSIAVLPGSLLMPSDPAGSPQFVLGSEGLMAASSLEPLPAAIAVQDCLAYRLTRDAFEEALSAVPLRRALIHCRSERRSQPALTSQRLPSGHSVEAEGLFGCIPAGEAGLVLPSALETASGAPSVVTGQIVAQAEPMCAALDAAHGRAPPTVVHEVPGCASVAEAAPGPASVGQPPQAMAELSDLAGIDPAGVEPAVGPGGHHVPVALPEGEAYGSPVPYEELLASHRTLIGEHKRLGQDLQHLLHEGALSPNLEPENTTHPGSPDANARVCGPAQLLQALQTTAAMAMMVVPPQELNKTATKAGDPYVPPPGPTRDFCSAHLGTLSRSQACPLFSQSSCCAFVQPARCDTPQVEDQLERLCQKDCQARKDLRTALQQKHHGLGSDQPNHRVHRLSRSAEAQLAQRLAQEHAEVEEARLGVTCKSPPARTSRDIADIIDRQYTQAIKTRKEQNETLLREKDAKIKQELGRVTKISPTRLADSVTRLYKTEVETRKTRSDILQRKVAKEQREKRRGLAPVRLREEGWDSVTFCGQSTAPAAAPLSSACQAIRELNVHSPVPSTASNSMHRLSARVKFPQAPPSSVVTRRELPLLGPPPVPREADGAFLWVNDQLGLVPHPTDLWVVQLHSGDWDRKVECDMVDVAFEILEDYGEGDIATPPEWANPATQVVGSARSQRSTGSTSKRSPPGLGISRAIWPDTPAGPSSGRVSVHPAPKRTPTALQKAGGKKSPAPPKKKKMLSDADMMPAAPGLAKSAAEPRDLQERLSLLKAQQSQALAKLTERLSRQKGPTPASHPLQTQKPGPKSSPRPPQKKFSHTARPRNAPTGRPQGSKKHNAIPAPMSHQPPPPVHGVLRTPSSCPTVLPNQGTSVFCLGESTLPVPVYSAEDQEGFLNTQILPLVQRWCEGEDACVISYGAASSGNHVSAILGHRDPVGKDCRLSPSPDVFTTAFLWASHQAHCLDKGLAHPTEVEIARLLGPAQGMIPWALDTAQGILHQVGLLSSDISAQIQIGCIALQASEVYDLLTMEVPSCSTMPTGPPARLSVESTPVKVLPQETSTLFKLHPKQIFRSLGASSEKVLHDAIDEASIALQWLDDTGNWARPVTFVFTLQLLWKYGETHPVTQQCAT